MGDPVNKKSIQVLFPCVHGLAKGQLVTINCFQSLEMKSTIKVVTGVDEDIARRVIGASRYGETDGRAAIGVMALFSNPLFSGESYGLALAVADKLARYPTVREWTEVYATGCVPADGCGKVKAIGDFSEKLDLLIEKSKPNSAFIYPADNLIDIPDLLKLKLNLLQTSGVECIAVLTVNDLQGKLWLNDAVNENKPTYHHGPVRKIKIFEPVWLPVFWLVLIGGIGSVVYFTFNATAKDQAPEMVKEEAPEKKSQSAEVINKRMILESSDTDSSLY